MIRQIRQTFPPPKFPALRYILLSTNVIIEYHKSHILKVQYTIQAGTMLQL